MASRTAPISKCRFRVLLTPISMLSKSTNTAIFKRSSTKVVLNPPTKQDSHKKAQKSQKVLTLVALVPFCGYFLKRLSKALRASDGLMVGALLDAPPESRVSRSMD